MFTLSVLGSTAAWGIGLGVACLIGLMAGFVIRPYVLPYVSFSNSFITIWFFAILLSRGGKLGCCGRLGNGSKQVG